jgi:L-ribulokinase
VGDIFDAIARRAGHRRRALRRPRRYKAGQTGLLRLSWDNGDRTVLVNPELGGVTLGWNLVHTAQDELFAAIEGTAFHTRIILERMAEHGVRIDRVINAGGIPQKNEVLNQVYANVLRKPVLVPAGIPTSLGSGIFALLAAGAYKTIEEAQAAVCLPLRTVEPDPKAAAVYEQLYRSIAMCTSLRTRLRWGASCRSCAGLPPMCERQAEIYGLQCVKIEEKTRERRRKAAGIDYQSVNRCDS